MPWESIGSTDTGEMPHEKTWILFSLEIALKYIRFVCGDPPPGNELGIMWHDHELGSYPSLGVWSDFTPDWDYFHNCESALEAFNGAVSWYELKRHYEEHTSSGNEDVEWEETE